MWASTAFGIVAAGLVLTACGTADPSGSADSGSSVETAPPITEIAVTTSSVEQESRVGTVRDQVVNESELVAAAVADLSDRLLRAVDDIEVLDTSPVEWPDGSLGCPEVGMGSTQAIVQGLQILLRSEDRVYDYRAGSSGEPVLCPSEDKDGGYDFVPPPGFDD